MPGGAESGSDASQGTIMMSDRLAEEDVLILRLFALRGAERESVMIVHT